jgi:hypothetical protein
MVLPFLVTVDLWLLHALRPANIGDTQLSSTLSQTQRHKQAVRQPFIVATLPTANTVTYCYGAHPPTSTRLKPWGFVRLLPGSSHKEAAL